MKRSLVGREQELLQIQACLQAKKNVLLEGPVGVGKTHLALQAVRDIDAPFFRVDGDNRYSEQKLSGWFDPPSVIKKGFTHESFIAGPLVEAMQKGGVLFINELNRLPEGVQNVLLPAIDERLITVPRIGEIRAHDKFLVIATQNPKEFVATSHLSEAILDRFELIVLDYQSEEEEVKIVSHRIKEKTKTAHEIKILPLAAVRVIRITRNHPKVRRGASIRAALSIAEIAEVMISQGVGFREAFFQSVLLALPTRIEFEKDTDSDISLRAEVESLLREWTDAVLSDLDEPSLKKKN